MHLDWLFECLKTFIAQAIYGLFFLILKFLMTPFKALSNFIKLGDVVKIKYFTILKKKRKIFELVGLCYYKNKKILNVKFSCNTEPVSLCLDINTPFLLSLYRLYPATPSNVKRNIFTYKNSSFNFTDFVFLNNMLRGILINDFDQQNTTLYYNRLGALISKNLLELAKIDKRSLFKIKKKYRI